VSPSTETRAIVKDAAHRLYELLVRVPFVEVSKPESGIGKDIAVHSIVNVQSGNTSRCVVMDVKSHAQLRDARQAVDQLKRYVKQLNMPAYPIFVSQYLSQPIKNFCVENGIGYFDFSGNCRLVFDQVFIEREVPASETPERKRLKSLFSLKSSRVMRRLLSDPHRTWKVGSLAQEAAVSPATISLIKEKLLGEEYAIQQGEGFSIVRPEQLLTDWARHYDPHEHKRIDCYGPAEAPDLERSFSDYCWKKQIKYAFTVFSGAKRIAPFVRNIQRGYAYISPEYKLEEVVADLKWKPVDSGANFRLMTPIDDDLFFGEQKVDGYTVVSDIQLYLDLATNRGSRAEENAELLLEQRIRPRW
jgi:hypothetical protein